MNLNQMSKLYINQSLVKDLFLYKDKKLCGLVFKNKWVFKQLGKSSKANRLGHYFEYLVTGALAKGETEPPKADTTTKGELIKDFKTAKAQAEVCTNLLHKYGITMLSAGENVIADDKWIGTLDIRAKWDFPFKDGTYENNPENNVIIDLKYSGLLEDKWSPFGWNLETLGSKEGTMFQAKHYKFLFWKKYGYNPPFYFFIFSSSTIGDCKMIEVMISDDELMEHEELLHKSKSYFEKCLDNGFEPLPDYNKCFKCDYADLCMAKAETPPIHTVYPF
tara:strand:- start:1239 stop:2069 length:831 start_codon:yes stop_codon:yes gene_type:complete